MIPKICANCEWGNNIANETGQVSLVICAYMPLAIAEYPNHSCGCFKMSANPQISFEEEKQDEEGE